MPQAAAERKSASRATLAPMDPRAFRLAVMLARVCVSESGFDAPDECVAIVHALAERASEVGVPLRSFICAYAPRSCDMRRRDRRRWIAGLRPDSATPPPGWPSGVAWETRRVRFAALVIVAYRASIGAVPSTCPGARHWGARWCSTCDARMERQGYERAGCGFRNAFFRRAR